MQTQLAAPLDLHLVAWMSMYAGLITDDGAGPRHRGRVIDDRTYRHTLPPGELDRSPTMRTAAAADDSDWVAILRGLARDLRTS